ncbi:MAG: sulfite exporter TauE/SafE family protein [Gemmatimonadetes bacterium]|nr:sulfite exporter TauE/SafE family protein [Gemmatimonadota bacterium]
MSDAWVTYSILFVTGGVAGTLNVLAGGGSFLTLPVMIFLGLPPTVANGTNRVAILVQSAGAVWGFHRHRMMDWSWLKAAVPPSFLGAAVGSWAAMQIGDEAFRRILAGIMVLVTLWTLWDPFSRRTGASLEGDAPAETGAPGTLAVAGGAGRGIGQAGNPARGSTALGRAGPMIALFLVGVYGGFVQAGVGFLILAVAAALGLDLVVGNALKVLLVLVYTPVAFGLFALSGNVDWGMGGVLAAGTLIGALVGVRLAVLKGHRWVRRVVIAAILVFAVKLWISP